MAITSEYSVQAVARVRPQEAIVNRWCALSGSQLILSRWENAPSPRDLLCLQDALPDWFMKICGAQFATGRDPAGCRFHRSNAGGRLT